jgi:FkbM family methyltransferase
MLLSFHDMCVKHDIKEVTGVLHVGAHLAEEAQIYQDELGDTPVWWIEANPKVFSLIEKKLENYPSQRLIQALVYAEDFVELDFNVTNYDGMSSSILEFGTHTQFSPDTKFVETIRLTTRSIDSLVEEHGIKANFLNMDLQGAELLALAGALEFLNGVDYVWTEVNNEEVYVDCAQVEDLDALLANYDLRRVETYWVPGQGWGDALYVRKHG